MKYLKTFNESIESRVPTKEDVIEFLKKTLVGFYGEENLYRMMEAITITPDGLVDIPLDLDLDSYDESIQKLPFKFGKVGEFNLNLPNLTTLEGCPHTCDDFKVKGGKIRDLRGCPNTVNGSITIIGIPLTSLEGCTKFIPNNFYCQETELTSLRGGPEEVGGYFICFRNNITDTVGGPKSVGGKYDVSATKLRSFGELPSSLQSLYVSTKNRTLWDPRSLKDCFVPWMVCQGEPIARLLDVFSWGIVDGSYSSASYRDMEKIFLRFRESLDYNYVRGDDSDPQINLFRFLEALDEFDIRDVIKDEQPHSVLGLVYRLVNDEGESVDFQGRPTYFQRRDWLKKL